jgi:urease accessory protein
MATREAATNRIGRSGELVLHYERQGSETRLWLSHCRSPWHFFPPVILDGGCAYTLLVNPSGGLVGGDLLFVRATLGPQAHVLFSTPSANRIYRSLHKPSSQIIEITVQRGGSLEWIPDTTIPFRGSRFRQKLHVILEEGATVLLWDAMASGRIARGERWVFADLENEIRMTTATGVSVLERSRIIPGSEIEGIGMMESWDYVASLYLVGDAIEGERGTRLEETIGDLLDGCRDRILGGVSETAVRGLVVKLLTRSAPDLNTALQSLWAAARAQLWGLPVPALRKY